MKLCVSVYIFCGPFIGCYLAWSRVRPIQVMNLISCSYIFFFCVCVVGGGVGGGWAHERGLKYFGGCSTFPLNLPSGMGTRENSFIFGNLGVFNHYFSGDLHISFMCIIVYLLISILMMIYYIYICIC